MSDIPVVMRIYEPAEKHKHIKGLILTCEDASRKKSLPDRPSAEYILKSKYDELEERAEAMRFHLAQLSFSHPYLVPTDLLEKPE